MNKTFTSHPTSVRGGRGRGRGRTQTNAVNEPALVGTGISPGASGGASRGAGRGGGGVGGAAGIRLGGGGGGGGGGVSRGRGGGAGAGRGQRTDPGLRGVAGGQDNASSRSPMQQRAMYAGGYTVIRPDEKRRREVTEQAERETRQYEQYRKQNKPSTFSYVGTAGGGEGVSLAEARQQQIRSQAQHSKASRLVREQDRRSQQRQEENRALADRREGTRKQTTLQMQKQKDTQGNWKSEMNRVNQAFLNRLEAQSKNPGPSSEQT